MYTTYAPVRFSFIIKILLLLVLSLIVSTVIFLLICIPGISTTFTDATGLERISAVPHVPLLAGEKIQGSFRPLYSHLGIVSVRFTNFGKINTDTVVFRLKEQSGMSWIYENTYKVDQFQPDQFFTFGFPIQPHSANKEYVFEVQSQSGQKGNAIGLSKYKPTLRLTYAFPKSSLFSHPSYILEIMRYKVMQKISQGTTQISLIGIYLFIFLLLFGVTHFNEAKSTLVRNQKVFAYPLFYLKHHPLLFIIFFGLFLRLLLAAGPFGGDTNAAMQIAAYPQHHIWNAYAHVNEHGYNDPPFIFFVFVALAGVKSILHIFSWPFLWRTFLSLFDLGTLFILIQLAKIKKISPVRTALLFFLNPVSIFISGYHGQFDNIAIFFLLLAVLLHYKTLHLKNSKRFLKWVYLTVGVLVKHIIVYQLLVFWQSEVKKKSTIVLLFSLSILIFLSSFVPFWFGTEKLIVNNVFLYGGISAIYGLPYFLNSDTVARLDYGDRSLDQTTIHKYIFIFLLFTIPLFLTRKDMLRNMLFMFLFFLTFTSGIGAQYFVLPIALGALFPTKWFYLYSIIVIFSFLGGFDPIYPLKILKLSFISVNVVWIFVTLWFISEFLYLSKTAQKLYWLLVP